MVPDDGGEQAIGRHRMLGRTIERIEMERSASVTDWVPSAESLRPVNGNTSGAALASAIDVHPADLVDQGIDQSADPAGIGAEDAHLLAVLR